MRRFNYTFPIDRLFAASPFKAFCAGIIMCLSSAAFLAAQTETEELSSFTESIRSLDSMDISGLDPDVASILSDYYRFTYTNAENWDKVESIRYEGEIRLAGGQAYRFSAFQKKPNYSKTVIYKEGKPLVIMSYDGIEAWTLNCTQSLGVVSMSEAEKLNFIRDAPVGGPLHYPQLQGKSIESKGAKVVRGRRCYELLISQPNGQQITSMIDATSFDEFQRTTINAINGEREVTTNIEYKVVENVRISTVSEMRVDGELRHSVEIADVRFNSGVSPWMFSRPSKSEVLALEAGEEQGSGLLFLPDGRFLGQPTNLSGMDLRAGQQDSEESAE